MKPLLSICCITYNQESYIKDTLDGFLMQQTNFPIEIIIHDDASTDKTADIIREYQDKYPDIFKPIFQKENHYSKGIKPFPNFVWPKAQGKYIAICEGDDNWTDPNKLQLQVDFLERNKNVSLCFHNALIKNHLKKSEKTLKNKRKEYYTTKDVIMSKWFCPTASIVFRKAVINLYLKSGVPKNIINGDLLMLFFASLLGKIYYLERTMCVYNLGVPGSLTQKLKTGKRLALYKSKLNFLLYVNKITRYKYVHFIIIKITMVFLAMFKSIFFRY